MGRTPPPTRRFGIPAGILAREPAPPLKKKKSPVKQAAGISPRDEGTTVVRSRRPGAMRSSLSLAYKQIVDYLRGFHQGRDKLPTDLAEVSTEELEEKRSQLRQL